MGRILGIDYGRRHIGLAISDPDGLIGTPMKLLSGSGSAKKDAHVITEIAGENDVTEFVVGLPLHMDGREGEQVRLTRVFVTHLKQESGLPVHLYDERLSTFAANRLLRQAELPPRERRKRQDVVAAGIILQGYLDSRRTQRDSASGDERE